MNTRRAFLAKTTMASAALFAANSLKSIAGTITTVTDLPAFDDKLILFHSGNTPFIYQYQALKKIEALKKSGKNILLVDGEKVEVLKHTSLNYHVTKQGNIKIGIIELNTNNCQVNMINNLSKKLKINEGCQLVVIISGLGYNNKRGIDDRKLAIKSSNIDIIISKHPTNFSPDPYIALNKKNSEVIINAAGKEINFGNIEIGFDRSNQKNAIAINNWVTPNVA